jgi:ribosomal protein S18 acetylase RimI-like enzyme
MSSTITVRETVRKATTADVPRLADTLAEAFFDDPVMSWCYPDSARRAQLLPEGFAAVLEATLPHGGVDTVADEVSGAIWVPPQADLDEDKLAADFGRIAAEYAERLFTLLELMGAHHPDAEPHQYLFVLGTRAGWQSQGIGSALMRSVLDGCDRDGVPAYLEATSERNRALYQRHGFEVTETVTLPDGPPFYCMWRTPDGAS